MVKYVYLMEVKKESNLLNERKEKMSKQNLIHENIPRKDYTKKIIPIYESNKKMTGTA